MFAKFALVASAFAFTLTSAALSSGNQLLDFSPAITTPDSTSVWQAGGTYTVKWDPTLPSNVTTDQVASTANIVLGYTIAGSTDQHLNTVLAQDVPLYSGDSSYDVTLPSDLKLSGSYIIALIGSSNNVSKGFLIIPSADGLIKQFVGKSSSAATATGKKRADMPYVA